MKRKIKEQENKIKLSPSSTYLDWCSYLLDIPLMTCILLVTHSVTCPGS